MLMSLCKDFDLEKRTVLAKLLIEDFHEDVIFYRCNNLYPSDYTYSRRRHISTISYLSNKYRDIH